MTTDTLPIIDGVAEPVQGPLDREVLAGHFAGYTLEPLISVALNPVTLTDAPLNAPGQDGQP